LQNNFWIAEGIAAYMESLVEHDPPVIAGLDRARRVTLGGDNEGRLPAARYRLLEDGFYVPLAQFCTLGMNELQKHPDVAKLYSQATGLATFLMHYDGGRYRPALERYLIAVYSGQDDESTLAKLAGCSYAQLDREYRQFLESGAVTDRDPAAKE
jgi:hypothetical protein